MNPVTHPLREIVLKNAIERYHKDIGAALELMAEPPDPGEFTPGYLLPEMDGQMRHFTSVSSIAYTDLGNYNDNKLLLLDLMRNPGTRTTKTLASLVIVARAVRYIRASGEPVMIVTPSSANKATALRDAVRRSIASGLVPASMLKIMTVVPASSAHKLWSSPLSEDPASRKRNPMVIYTGSEGAAVKQLARDFTRACSAEFRTRFGVNLWHTLSLANYMPADAVRGFAEFDCLPKPPPAGRLHVHAVSSAFGLLGHNLGYSLREPNAAPPRYWLVQHLATPDMVLSLHHDSADRSNLPDYTYDSASRLYKQRNDLRYPAITRDPGELLDPTFYTHRPSTSKQMNDIIRSRGGGGIVVSRYECLSRYDQIKSLLASTRLTLPDDPDDLREWSLVMAMTGTLNAIDRGLIVQDDEIVIHGSGSYTADDFEVMPDDQRTVAANRGELAGIAAEAIRAA